MLAYIPYMDPMGTKSQNYIPPQKKPNWLVVWNMFLEHVLLSPILGMMIQSDELIFFLGGRAKNHQPA